MRALATGLCVTALLGVGGASAQAPQAPVGYLTAEQIPDVGSPGTELEFAL